MEDHKSLGGRVATPDTGDQQDAERLERAILKEGHPLARSLEQLESSQAAMRDATKWLVAAAAAVGAVLVAGLQLKDVPHGFWATLVALLGIAAALLAVGLILHRAAGVLVAGYTTFGQILKLRADEGLRDQREKVNNWGNRLNKMKAKPETPPKGFLRRTLRAIQRAFASAASLVWNAEATKDFLIRPARNEGLRIEALIRYLNTDTFYFTQGLAEDIPGLDVVLRDADIKILDLRGELIAGGSTIKTPGVDRLKLQELAPSKGPSPDNQVALVEAEWRQGRLEAAMAVLVAFANQKLLEQRFRKLLSAILYGGIVIAFGVGAFVVAPKLDKPQGLSITQPTQVSMKVVKGLGKSCTPGTLLQGIAVGGTWDEPVVVTEEKDGCPAQEVTLNKGQAVAVPVLGSAPSASTAPSP